MNFANLSPADRTKVIVLLAGIGICFVLAGTMIIGAVSGKSKPKTAAKSSQTAASPKGSDSSAGAPIGTAPGDFPGVSNQPKSFDLASAVGTGAGDKDPFAPEPSLESNTPPAYHNKPAVRATPAGPASAPAPARPANFGLPAGDFGAPAAPPSAAPVAPAGLTAAPIEPVVPEIRLIGIVAGQPSVATLSVAGKTVIAQDGDLLAPGYRLLAISTEGIALRHAGVVQKVRVGMGINSPANAAASRTASN